jgi:aminoglycoside phosphotransferase (APT) family kinase protein
VCRLWAGMGHIYRITDEAAARKREAIIVKWIRLPSKPGSSMSLGDRRKADSYHVEANFYRHVAARLLDNGVGIPRPLHVEKHDDRIVIGMTELRGRSLQGDSLDDVRSVLAWMAKFHSLYWGHTEVGAIVTEAGLQPVGTYWHLDTRPDEHSNMPRSGLSGRLRLAARAIDLGLKKSPFQCLVHGDPKDANILLAENSGNGDVVASLYDFQYCGKGPPAKDVAYFLCSSVDDGALDTDSLVAFYHEQLVRNLTTTSGATSESTTGRRHLVPTLQQLNELLDLALCDYYRFMCGWGHWGSLQDAERRVRSVLDRLDGGTPLKSPNEYEEAVEREFGTLIDPQS